MNTPRKIAYVLSYYDPNYIRSRTLMQALGTLENVQLIAVTNKKRGLLRYVETLWKLLCVRFRTRPQYYVLGFRGHEIFWPVRILTWGFPLYFDELMSPTDALITEKKAGAFGVILGKCLRRVEKAMLRASNAVFTDTTTHKKFLETTFELDPAKVFAVPVAADEAMVSNSPTPAASGRQGFCVFFYGTFLPLHGMAIIIAAAKKLASTHSDIQFVLVGGGEGAITTFTQGQTPTNIQHIAWIPFNDLLNIYIPKADLCLGGPFGGTPQALRVVTGKAQQFLCMAKATLIGQIHENEGFVDKHNCLLVPQNDAAKLAEAILWSYQNREELSSIGQEGRRLYEQRFSIQALRQRLKESALFAK